MSKALPLKWFPGYTAQIRLGKVDGWAEVWAKQGTRPYFDTWEQARDYMIETTTKKINRLNRDLASERRHLVKVQNLQKPDEEKK